MCATKRFSTCPDQCEKRCIPTSCTEDSTGKAVCTDDCEGLGSCIDPSYENYETTFSGALVYNISLDKGFIAKGKMTHYSEEDTNKMGSYWPYDYEKNIQRIIYIGENLYSISLGMIKSADIETVTEKNKITLGE